MGKGKLDERRRMAGGLSLTLDKNATIGMNRSGWGGDSVFCDSGSEEHTDQRV